MRPTRCCVLTQKGTRCANEPSPVRPVRMIGPVRLAACGLDGHQRALWSLPGFIRHDAYCGAFGCDRPSNAGICQKHRDMYRDFGITEHMLLAQEAPMTEPTPPSKLPELGFRRVQIQASSASLADLEAAATGMTIPTPPAAPQEAADGGATPSAHFLEARRDRLVATLLGAGFEEKPAISGRVRRFAYCNDYWVIVPNGPAAESQEDFARALDTAEAALKRLTSTVDAPHLPVAPAPADDGAMWRPLTAAEVEAALDTVMPLDVPAAPPATVEEFLRDLESGDGEPSLGDIQDAYSGRWGQYTVGIDPATGQERTAVRVVVPTLDGLAALAARGQQPTAPGPTLAEVQAELERERDRADRAELDAVAERERADEALEELAAIAAMLDPEDAPAFDADDQPIPLPVRVQTALMPDKPGQSRIEREIAAVLDRYEAPTTLGSVHVGVKGRVLVTARALRDSTAVSNQMATEITEASALLTTLGANVTSSPRDALLQVLAALLPDVYRRLLESEAANARAALASLQARVVNPPPPEKLAEAAAKVAEVEAKIAALDAGEVQK